MAYGAGDPDTKEIMGTGQVLDVRTKAESNVVFYQTVKFNPINLYTMLIKI